MNTARPPLASGRIDRDARTRMDIDALAAAWEDPRARLLRLQGVQIPVLETSAGGLRLALVPTTGGFLPQRADGSIGQVYVGRRDGAPVFAEIEQRQDRDATDPASSSADPAHGSAPEGASGVPGAEWRHPFEVGIRLDETERELIGVASALLRWHESSGFSSRDGENTVPALGGWARHDAHGGEHFPRTDPAVIVLIEHEGRVLLGSNVLWETGRFSLLAGFVEAGESAEQTVEREILEEAGVRVGDIEYVVSQPWPFPRSLMLGFRARLAADQDPADLAPDPEEISELRWFSRDEVRNPAPGIRLPQGLSIARWLLDRWVAEGDSEEDVEHNAAEHGAAEEETGGASD